MPTIHCEYISESQLNSLGVSGGAHLALFHANVRSVPKNMDALLNVLSATKAEFSVISLTETWLTENNSSLYSIPNYSLVSMTRKSRIGGGISIYLLRSLVYKERTDLSMCSDDYEALFLEILNEKSNNTIIGVIYRPPAMNVQSFVEYLSQTLARVNTEKKVCYILGDFNLDVSRCDSRTEVQSFLDIMHSSSFIPLIDKPTRITDTSATIIDLIFTNDLNTPKSRILVTDISDHYPVFCYSDRISSENSCRIGTLKYRQINDNSKIAFKEFIDGLGWESVYSELDAQIAYSNFMQELSMAYEAHFPILERRSTKSDLNPWLTSGIKKSIKNKNKLYIRYRNRPNIYNKIQYLRYKYSLAKIISTAKKSFYQTKISENYSNAKKTWEVLNDILSRKKTPGIDLKIANINGEMCSDQNKIVNALNKYFVDVGTSLDQLIPQCPKNPLDYLSGNHTNSLFLNPVTETEVLNCMQKLKKSSAGHDEIKPEIIKLIPSVAYPLTHIINLCFQQSIFPTELKRANVTPIHKGGDSSVFSNYRPISVLPVFSKIFERLLHQRLMSFFTSNNIISDSQFGFRKGYSTELALARTIDEISTHLDNGNIVIGMFLDLKKAFDTVNHSILLNKLYHYGVRGNPHLLLKNYLSQRCQSSVLNSSRSSLEFINCGVPQGSILGPLLFIVYLNDLSNALTNTFPIMYADDTNIFLAGNNLNEMTTNFNRELEELSTYFRSNRLSLNLTKTHAMIFSTNHHTRQQTLNLKIDDSVIETVCSTTFLGVKIENSLSWSSHINYIANKISKVIGAIKKASKVLNRETLLSLYSSLIDPYIQYCNLIWGNAPKTHLNRILILQKWALRIAYGLGPRDHTGTHFIENNILRVDDLFRLSCSIFLYKLKNAMYPSSIMNHFYDAVFNYNNLYGGALRSASRNETRVQRCRTTLRMKTFSVYASRLYNEFILPYDVMSISHSLAHFKKLIRSLLIGEY